MAEVALVAVGGAIGAVLRYLVSVWTGSLSSRPKSVTGTVIVNVTGSLAAGLLLGWFAITEDPRESAGLLLSVGLLGSYTTFSTFILELSGMVEEKRKDLILYLFWQLVVAVFAAAIGIVIGAALAGGSVG